MQELKTMQISEKNQTFHQKVTKKPFEPRNPVSSIYFYLCWNLTSYLNRVLEPDKPVVYLQSDQTTTTSFSFIWDAPKNPYGEIKHYNVYVKFSNFSYYNPIECDNDFKREVTEILMVDVNREYTFHEALPYAEYFIQVQVLNSGDYTSDFSNFVTCKTLPGAELNLIIPS